MNGFCCSVNLHGVLFLFATTILFVIKLLWSEVVGT